MEEEKNPAINWRRSWFSGRNSHCYGFATRL